MKSTVKEGRKRLASSIVAMPLSLSSETSLDWSVPEESSSRWRECLEGLGERGVGEPLLFVTDGLQGMPEANAEAFPSSLRQRCLVHVGTNMSSAARRKDRGAILDGFREVYSAPTEEEARARLAIFVARWARTYPSFRKYLSERDLLTSCAFPAAIRKALYTSNPVESFHACLKRKLRSRLGVHSLANGRYLIAREAERHDLPRHNRRIAGYDELTDEEMSALGMGKREGLNDCAGMAASPAIHKIRPWSHYAEMTG